MALATNLGYPRIGAKRELKKALESYWAGKSSAVELEAASRELRLRHWRLQRERGIQHIPSNDSSLYDHVLDTAALAGAVPARFNWDGDRVDLNTYFAMARGSDATPAMEMTKWFNTNYHYIVPEFEPGQRFRLASRKPLDEFREAQAEGIHSRPKLLGPVSFLLLGKTRQGGPEPLSLLESLLPVYEELLAELAAAGADWIQIDEPCLVLDLTPQAQAAFRDAYARLGALSSRLRLLLTTYFGDLRENLPTALALPVAGLHLDLVRGPGGLDPTLAALPADCVLSLGLIDGRNVWRTDLDQALATLQRAQAALGPERLFVAPSCSLLHVPVDLDQESALDPELRSWLSFADQKIDELTFLTRALNEGPASVAEPLAHQRRALESRRRSQRTRAPAVRQRTAAIDAAMLQRASPYPQRRALQRARLQLPLLPTTTIGSFPQTPEIRRARARFRNGRLAAADYETFLEAEIDHVIRFQEEIGLDVLVHGEPERSDMSEYFGERLDGIAVTAHGWVQSYGSRCARPPIIYGDVSRPTPMTVRWARYAQSRTTRPVKGMLTGPLTLLQWSFVRDDQPRRETARQLALALRDEVAALEAAGLKIIQIDEPALREGLPPPPRPMALLPRLGRRGLPPRRRRRPRRNADPDPRLLCRIRRHRRLHRRDGRRRHPHRSLPLRHGPRRLRRLALPQRDRPRRLRHPLAPRPIPARDRGAPAQGAGAAAPRTGLGQSRLRPQDPPLGGSRPQPPRARCCRPPPARKRRSAAAHRRRLNFFLRRLPPAGGGCGSCVAPARRSARTCRARGCGRAR